MNTPPMPLIDAPWSIVSMVSNADVQMYLLSLKSFYRKIGRGKVIAIIDRDMPFNLRDILMRHFPGIRFAILEELDVGACQRGGTWERLLYVIDRASDEYTIQIDCDTLTFGAEIDEVLNCVENNVAFTLSGAERRIVTMPDAARMAASTRSDYVGIFAERLFSRFPDSENLYYVRASSGFAGFAKGGFSRERMELFHGEMNRLVGPRWVEWGTEQCGSNFAIANSPGAVVLPFPKYANYGPETARGQGTFLHFIGTYRYLDDYFAELGIGVIEDLQNRVVNGPAVVRGRAPF